MSQTESPRPTTGDRVSPPSSTPLGIPAADIPASDAPDIGTPLYEAALASALATRVPTTGIAPDPGTESAGFDPRSWEGSLIVDLLNRLSDASADLAAHTPDCPVLKRVHAWCTHIGAPLPGDIHIMTPPGHGPPRT